MNCPSFRHIPSTLHLALAAGLWCSLPIQAQPTRMATFGSLSSSSGPFVPAGPLSQVDPANGIIHEEEFRIKPFVTESLLDQKTVCLGVTFCQDGLVPLGRFVMGTVDIRWTAYGWWASDSGRFSATGQLASAVTVPIWQATDVRALKVDFNVPVTVNGDLKVTGKLSIPAKGGISMGIYGVPTP